MWRRMRICSRLYEYGFTHDGIACFSDRSIVSTASWVLMGSASASLGVAFRSHWSERWLQLVYGHVKVARLRMLRIKLTLLKPPGAADLLGHRSHEN
jgi:hypothetical protein